MPLFDTLTARNKIKSMIADANITYVDGTTNKRVPIIYPNINAKEGQRPRIEMEHAMSRQSDNTLNGNTRLEERGLYEFRVIVEYGQGEELCASICKRIQQIYPAGSYITITDGVIQFPEVPSIGEFVGTAVEGIGQVLLEYIVTSR